VDRGCLNCIHGGNAVAFERRLPVFLTALSTETLRLFASESKDWGEALTKATNQEWIPFLAMIEEHSPLDKQIHLIIDNYSAHKHANVLQWLAEHPRFHIHYTPPAVRAQSSGTCVRGSDPEMPGAQIRGNGPGIAARYCSVSRPTE